MRRLGTLTGFSSGRSRRLLAKAGLYGPAVHAMRPAVAYVTGAVLRKIETTPHLGGVPMNAHDSAIDPAWVPPRP
jgi:hypothetical protein